MVGESLLLLTQRIFVSTFWLSNCSFVKFVVNDVFTVGDVFVVAVAVTVVIADKVPTFSKEHVAASRFDNDDDISSDGVLCVVNVLG